MGEQLTQAVGSAAPLTSLALPHSVPSRWQGQWAPWGRERAEVLGEEGALPWVCAGQGRKASGLVSKQRCCPPMARHSATHCCADTPWSHTLQQAPTPTEKAKGGGTWWSVSYSFWLGVSETCSQMADPAGRAPHSVQALALGLSPFQPSGLLSLWSLVAVELTPLLTLSEAMQQRSKKLRSLTESTNALLETNLQITTSTGL